MGVRVKQPPASQHQIGQTEQREELCRVLGQALVARLAMAKQILHDMKRVLDFGTDGGLGMLELFQQITQSSSRQGLALARLHGDVPGYRNPKVFFPLLDTLIACVAEDIRFVAVQQRLGLGNVTHIASCTDDGMHQA